VGPVGPVGRGGPPGGTIWLKFDAATPVGPVTRGCCAAGWCTGGVGAIGGAPPAPTRICDIWAVGGAITAGPEGVAAPIGGGGIIAGGRVIPGGPPGGAPIVAAGGRALGGGPPGGTPGGPPGGRIIIGGAPPGTPPVAGAPGIVGGGPAPGAWKPTPGGAAPAFGAMTGRRMGATGRLSARGTIGEAGREFDASRARAGRGRGRARRGDASGGARGRRSPPVPSVWRFRR